MLGGNNLLRIIGRVPGIRAQVHNGRVATLTTISSSQMRRSLVATREDACPSLLVASMTIPRAIMTHIWDTICHPWVTMSNRWNTLTLTLGWLPSRRVSMRSRTPCTNIPSGKKKQDNALPPSSSTKSRRIKIGSTYSRVSTSTCPSKRPQQQPAWGGAPITSGKFCFLYFIIFFS